MSGSSETSKGTDRRIGLTPERVVEVAMELSRGGGLSSWTVRDLADALDVAPSVIYHHVGGRDLIIRGVVERVLQGMTPPDPALDWQAWFRAFLYDGRPAIDPYPGVAKWLIMHGPTFPSIRGFFDAGISTLERAGFPQPALVYALLVNTAMLTITMSDDRLESGDDGPRDHASMLRDFSAMNVESSGISRMIREVLGPLAEDPTRAGEAVNDAYYHLLVETLLTGLAARLP
ncbi:MULTISPECIES: TetR/AcrR family transcriptional regulator [Microbacteriaceae]|nr:MULTISPECIES: TetR/AcrR family transcriptional regulator [Microbacteriaceae]